MSAMATLPLRPDGWTVNDLERRRAYADADELVITTQIHDAAERALSYELIAKAYAA